MMQALDIIFQQHSLAFRHDFRALMLLLDIDLTGMPCGKKCEYAAKGYQGEVGIRSRPSAGPGPCRAARRGRH
jgi:hypothetical protein